MRETRADTAQALTFALLLHLLLFALVYFGLHWSRTLASSAAGSPVQADLVDPNALSAATRRSLATVAKASPAQVQPPPAPQPLPAPRPQDAPVPRQVQAQERVPVPDQVDQERVDREALSAETAAREQEAKRRQEQIDLTERQRQDEAQQQQQLARQLADIRKQREKARRDADLAQQKLQQLADADPRNAAERSALAAASASPPPGNNGVDKDLQARYAAALTDAILHNWTRPDNIQNGVKCRITIRQVIGGSVVDVQVSPDCPFDALGRRSVEAAVLKAQPLPYAGFENVFRRTLELDFIPHD